MIETAALAGTDLVVSAPRELFVSILMGQSYPATFVVGVEGSIRGVVERLVGSTIKGKRGYGYIVVELVLLP